MSMTFAEQLENAAKYVGVLRTTREVINAALTPEGTITDIVSLQITKEQAAVLLVLVDDFLK